MNEIVSAVVVLLGIGFFSSLLLVFASKVFHVPSDQRADELAAALPGANCGSCGFAGCADYAAAVAKGDAAVGQCTPGGDKASKAMAAIMGIDAVDVVEKVAVVRCRGSYEKTSDKYDYTGVKTCAGAVMLFKGSSACKYGCLGYGDCTRACAFSAISVENGVACVNTDICEGCGACAKACPKGIIEIIPAKKQSLVHCMNHDKGGVTRKVCIAGCIGCGKCVKICPSEAIKLDGNLAVVDVEKCIACGLCVSECPTGAISFLEKEQKSL